MSYFLVIVIASLLEYIGDSNFKKYARLNKMNYLFFGLFAYIVMIMLLIYLLRKSNVMYMNSLWDATSIIMETILAYILLNETMSNNYQYGGLLLVVIGIILLNTGKIPVN